MLKIFQGARGMEGEERKLEKVEWKIRNVRGCVGEAKEKGVQKGMMGIERSCDPEEDKTMKK